MKNWKTLNSKTIILSGNNFIEINLKQPPESEEFLIGISKGWITTENKKIYKNNILFHKDKKKEIIDILNNIDKDF